MRNVTITPEGQPTEVERFIERFALVLAEAGMARMPARVFSALIVKDDGKMTAGEIADTVRVSPAAVSGAVRYLMQVELIVRRRDPGERRDHYEVTDDMWYEAYASRDKMLDRWAGSWPRVFSRSDRHQGRLAAGHQPAVLRVHA